MKITLYTIPEGMAPSYAILHPETWDQFKKLDGVATFNAGGKTKATGIQISRVVWELRDDLRSSYYYSQVTRTEGLWERTCYRAHEAKSGDLCAPLLLDNPEQWSRFTPRIGYLYKTKVVNPTTGKQDTFAIFGKSERKLWYVSTWSDDTLSWSSPTSAYPGTLGPWHLHGGVSAGEVICREIMGSYTFFKNTASEADGLNLVARHELPSYHWRDENLRERILNTLAKANGYLWLSQGFCPVCASEDKQSEFERRFDDYVHCPSCKCNADELAKLVGILYEECDQCRGEPVMGRDGDGDYDYCDACSGRGFWVTEGAVV